ncbi:MAG: phosphoribosylformylglycinamidine cyclo-ligase [Chloroflexota bacterium]
MKPGFTYRDAGVDVEAGDRAVELIKAHAKRTHRDGVIGEIGMFGGLFGLDTAKYRQPVLVSGTDGVGTKLMIAFLADRHETIGQDCVAMCVNDILVQGAEPLFFLDYVACGKLTPEKIATIVGGVADGCRLAGCALIGGETAEMPGMYEADEYDLAGFAVGVVERDRIIDGSAVRAGDALIGIASSGLHSNGYSLVRKVLLEAAGYRLDDDVPALGKRLGDELLTPTRIYRDAVMAVLDVCEVHGMAHITGGGITGNLSRILPEGTAATLERWRWRLPPIFELLQLEGSIDWAEMYGTFNCGLGLIMALPRHQADVALKALDRVGEQAWLVGEVVAGDGRVEIVDRRGGRR